MSDFPEYKEPEDLEEEVKRALGVSTRQEAIWRSKVARWSKKRWLDELGTSDWRDRFDVDYAFGLDQKAQATAADRLPVLLQRGPVKLADKSSAELLELVREPSLKQLISNYPYDDPRGILIAGPTGCGKSVAAVAMLRQKIMNRARQPPKFARDEDSSSRDSWAYRAEREVYVRAMDLALARLQQGLGGGETPLVASAMEADWLVLDDLGWESKRASADEVVCEVLARRYDAGLPTITTTGLKIGQIVDKYGDAILRRLVEIAGTKGKVLDLWPLEKKHGAAA